MIKKLQNNRHIGPYIHHILSDKYASELTKGSVISFVFKAISLPLSLFVSLLISRGFGEKAMGIYGLITSIIGMGSSLAMMGISSSITRFVGQAKQDKTYTGQEVYRGAWHLVLISSLIGSLFLFFGATWIANGRFGEPLLVVPLQVAGMCFIPIVRYNFNDAYLNANKQIYYSKLLSNGIYFGFLVLGLLAIYFFVSKNAIVPSVRYLSIHLVLLGISLRILWKEKILSLRGKVFSYRKILQVSLPMIITAMAGFVLSYSDILMIGWLGTTEEIGIYKVVLAIGALVGITSAIVNPMLGPQIAELFWSKKEADRKKLQILLRRSMRVTAMVSSLITMGLVVLGKWGLSFFGVGFITGYKALLVVGIGSFICALCGPVGMYLNNTGRQKIVRNVFLLFALINIIINYLLIGQRGIVGAGTGFMVSLAGINIFLARYIWRQDKIKIFVS